MLDKKALPLCFIPLSTEVSEQSKNIKEQWEESETCLHNGRAWLDNAKNANGASFYALVAG